MTDVLNKITINYIGIVAKIWNTKMSCLLWIDTKIRIIKII